MAIRLCAHNTGGFAVVTEQRLATLYSFCLVRSLAKLYCYLIRCFFCVKNSSNDLRPINDLM